MDAAEAQRLASGMGVPGQLVDAAARFLVGLAELYVQLDCSLAEINPLVHTEDGAVRALDAKIRDRKSTRLNSSQIRSRMPSSA